MWNLRGKNIGEESWGRQVVPFWDFHPIETQSWERHEANSSLEKIKMQNGEDLNQRCGG